MNSLRNFAGKTVFISGASRGIGKAIALAFGSRGANVIVTGKTVTPHQKLPGTIMDTANEIEKCGGKALPLEMDIRDADLVEATVKKAVDHFKTPITVLINNASAISLTDTLNTTMKNSKSCIPFMKKEDNPHIINLSPPLDMNPIWFKNFVAYTMSKFGMSMCVLGMAEELKEKGIAVNALWPKTAIATEAIKLITGKDEDSYKMCRKPDILSDCALLIASQNSSQLTGNFFIDEDFLKANGVTDFDKYSYVPGTTNFMPDFFVPGTIPDVLNPQKENFKPDDSLRSGELDGYIKKFKEILEKGDYSDINKVTQFQITFNSDNNEFWHIDFPNKKFNINVASQKADIYIKAPQENILRLLSGKTNPVSAYMTGDLKFKGSYEDAKIITKIWTAFTKK